MVYGHTPTYGWVWWLLGGIVVVGLFAAFVVRAQRRALACRTAQLRPGLTGLSSC